MRVVTMNDSFLRRCVYCCVLLIAAQAAAAQDPQAIKPAPGQTPAAKPAPRPDGPAPRLEVDSTAWNFGTVWEGVPVSTDITLKNTGNAPLRYMFKKTCGCILTEANKEMTLAPGETRVHEVGYATKTRKGRASQIVKIHSNDQVSPEIQLRITGEVKPRFRLEPSTGLQFGRLTRDSKMTRTAKISVLYDEKMFLKLKETSTGPFLIKLKEIEPGLEYEITATTNPPLELGVVKPKYILQTGIDDFPELAIEPRGLVQPLAKIMPAKLYVPKLITRPSVRMLRLSYLAGSPIKITGFEYSHPDSFKAEVAPSTTSRPVRLAQLAHTIRVSVPPGPDVPPGATLTILTDAEDPQYAKFVVPITNQPEVRRAPARPGGTETAKPEATSGERAKGSTGETEH